MGLLFQSKKDGQEQRTLVAAARKMADEAKELSHEKRIKHYGFAARFQGRWGELLHDKVIQ